MSRYYEVTVIDPADNLTIKKWTSEPLPGIFDPQAQNIDIDLLAYNYATPAGASTLSIEGVSIHDIGQAQMFTGMTVQVKGGMKKGLPLAKPAQSGVLLTGQVFQSFGNWEGTNMTLDFVFLASPYTFDQPGNFVLTCPKGTNLSGAIKQMLSVNFPTSNVVINLDPNRVYGYDLHHVAHTLEQASDFLREISKGQFGLTDPGIQVTMTGAGNFYVYDYTQPSNPFALDFNDFVGQPVWIAPYKIQMKLVLRADLSVGTLIKLPSNIKNLPGIVTTQPASLPSYNKYSSVFQGNFYITSLRHVGNFRSPAGENWVTILEAVFAGRIEG